MYICLSTDVEAETSNLQLPVAWEVHVIRPDITYQAVGSGKVLRNHSANTGGCLSNSMQLLIVCTSIAMQAAVQLGQCCTMQGKHEQDRQVNNCWALMVPQR